jgi:lipopolysaccharide biosynthesis glycosyltransferase
MRWFFALNAECMSFGQYAEMVQVAVWSALRHTRLQPHFLYHGEDDPPLLSWLRDHGVNVWRARSRFYDELCSLEKKLKNPDARTCGGGAYLRVEIIDLLAQHGIRDTQILYTDCDVMFQHDPEPILRSLPCRFIACGPESMRGTPTDINTGVLLMHVARLRRFNKEFIAFTRGQLEHSVTAAFDQAAYRNFFRGPLPQRSWPWKRGWNALPDELNWKPYWGENPDAVVVHFHGPKPFQRDWLKTAPTAHILKQVSGGAYQKYTDQWLALRNEIYAEGKSPARVP